MPSDTSLDCAGFDDELLKANAIRDAIWEEHGDVITDAALIGAFDLLTDPVAGLLSGVVRGAHTQNAIKQYAEAATAAALRMQQLLVYKEEHSCQSGPTAVPGLTDDMVLNELRKLDSQIELQDIAWKQYFVKRQKLLDDLR